MGRGFWLKVSLLVAILCLGAGGLAFAGEPAPLKPKAGKEILVAKDVFVGTPLWCRGSDILAYQKRDEGLFYYEPKTGKSTRAADDYNVPIACSPDGEWLVYMDEDSYRYHKNNANNPLIADFWRYEFKTGKRQKISAAEARYDAVVFNEPAFSSAGRIKLCVAGLHAEDVEMPEPKWEVERSERGCARWRQNDGTAVSSFYGEPNAMGHTQIVRIESPGNEAFEIYPPYTDFLIHSVDRKDRLYLTVYGDGSGNHIERCEVDIKGKWLTCNTAFGSIPTYGGLGISSDGEMIVFSGSNPYCVKAARIEDKAYDAPCISTSSLNYYYNPALSSDDKRVAFGVTLPTDDENIKYFDLYIVTLEK